MQDIPEKEIMGHIADLFKGFADPTRVHILSLLLVRSELCVTELADAVGVSISGAQYPLKEAQLTANFPLGVSNHFIGNPITVSVRDGSLLIGLLDK